MTLPLDSEELVTCTSCQVPQPYNKFKKRGVSGRQAHTRHSMCNRCLYIKYTRPNVERKTELIQDYKLEKGCVDCGFNAHPAALEFDHLPGTEKTFNVMEKIGNYSLERLWEEIAKCEVVCANCHAIRTATRRIRVELVL